MITFHKDESFDAQFKRSIGYCVAGGADPSECFSIIKKVRSGDYVGWHNAWRELADGLFNSAVNEKSASASEKLLRCSNYYRTAYFFLEENHNDSKIVECLELSKKAFSLALKQLNIKYTPLEIPFEGGFLPGYLFFTDNPKSKLILDTGGGDSILEELYFTSTIPSLKKGYNSLIFEGPGQGSVLRLQKKVFRHDWETVVGAVIDHLEKVAPGLGEHIILRGDSFGGYLAARAAAYEKRIKACILNPGMLNPMKQLRKLESGWLRSMIFFLSPSTRFKINSRMFRFGATSFSEFLEKCSHFHLEDAVKQITIPTLVIDNEEEPITKGEAIKFYEQLQCPKEYYLFKKEQCTGGHCQPLGQIKTEELIFDWLKK
jgi:predicted alpha/beta-fold hydrolase